MPKIETTSNIQQGISTQAVLRFSFPLVALLLTLNLSAQSDTTLAVNPDLNSDYSKIIALASQQGIDFKTDFVNVQLHVTDFDGNIFYITYQADGSIKITKPDLGQVIESTNDFVKNIVTTPAGEFEPAFTDADIQYLSESPEPAPEFENAIIGIQDYRGPNSAKTPQYGVSTVTKVEIIPAGKKVTVLTNKHIEVLLKIPEVTHLDMIIGGNWVRIPKEMITITSGKEPTDMAYLTFVINTGIAVEIFNPKSIKEKAPNHGKLIIKNKPKSTVAINTETFSYSIICYKVGITYLLPGNVIETSKQKKKIGPKILHLFLVQNHPEIGPGSSGSIILIGGKEYMIKFGSPVGSKYTLVQGVEVD